MSADKDERTPDSGVTPEEEKNNPEASEEASGVVVSKADNAEDPHDDPSLEDVDDDVEEDIEEDSDEIDSAEEASSKDAAGASPDSDSGDGSDGGSGDGPPQGGDDADDGDGDDGDGDDEEGEAEEEGELGGHMSLLDHLGELRQRLVRCVLAVIVGMLVCYSFAERMFDILMEPMKEVLRKVAQKHMILPADFFENLKQGLAQSLQGTDFKYFDKLDVFVQAMQDSMSTVMVGGHFQYTYPAEAFFSHIKIAIVAGIFLMSPYLFAQLWGFIAPGLYSHERKYVIPMAIISAMFFVGGGMFGYFVVFPFGFDFFASFANSEIAFTPKLNEYLSFCLKLLFAFGIVFELPLFILFLARMGLVTSRGLRQKQKYAILLSFVMSAVLTPPDPFTQCLMAGPLILLYELGIWVAYLFGKREKRHMKADEAEEAQASEDEAEETAEAALESEAEEGKADPNAT